MRGMPFVWSSTKYVYSTFRYRDGTADVVFVLLDKIAGSDFEQPQAGPQGEGQDARSI